MIKLITQYASRKSINSVPKIEMVNFNHINDIDERSNKWLDSLNNQSIKTTSWKLYKGHFYQILNESLNKLDNVEKCIISTGYGILYENDIATDYMVTYASHIDEPTKINQLKGVDFKDWHNILCKKRNVKPIYEWVYNDDIVIVILGNGYINIIEEDLKIIYNKLNNKDNFIVISIGNKNLPNTLPVKVNWRKWLGGPQNVMGPNIFKKIIEDKLPLNFTELNKHFNDVYLPQVKVEDVKIDNEFIKNYIKNNININQNKILTKLRKEGYSCSKERLNKIYKESSMQGA